MQSRIYSEQAFEDYIEDYLINNAGYIKGNREDYNKELALDKKILFSFLETTQPDEIKKLKNIHKDSFESKFLYRLTNELESRGMLDLLRHGFIDYGVRIKLAYFKPASGLNPETERLYMLNKISVTRQVKYSIKNENSIDMLLCINGLPVATIELKNQFTGQNAGNAKIQYKFDRDPKELLFQFKKRALVHFAVDTDEVYMTTKLEGEKTKYLPFNQGYNKGSGNPPHSDGYMTYYLWENILTKDSLMDLISSFLHIETKEYKLDGVTKATENLIFPRFHQIDAVRKLTNDARIKGVGNNYLIQHSAGSGKSNSIAWLAYRLASLHDKDDKRIFDSVIVITDRRVLDHQLQDTIYQFEHKQGVVQKIDKDSNQLAECLNSGSNIIITTLQKFPFVIDKIGEIQARKYALIVDEAHSSQGGEGVKKMKEALIARTLEEAEIKDESLEDNEDFEDEIRKSMMARGRRENLSFFAFTATPKAKTLEVFGTKDENGKPIPFHLYSMRQAIEEGFIMDVLKNYVTYKLFFKLSKSIEDDPDINKIKASKAIARFVSLHPYNLSQKTEVIIEHFRQVVLKKIGGKAKAMVVTSSRLHVVKYKEAFDSYIKEKGYKDIKAIVAFSGTVRDELSIEYTETGMNKFGERQLPDKFNTSEFNILLVADKYQTGFDQPLLHTMYVDKKLSGIKAVQTLSRLNRICPGKEDTFILDFVNEKQIILDSFQPYYEITTTDNSDPNLLYNIKNELDKTQLFINDEIDNFCKILFKKDATKNKKNNALLNSFIDPAVVRFKNIEHEDKKEEIKHKITVFLRMYAFLSQIMPFSDIDLEKFYIFLRYYLSKLPRVDSDIFKLYDEVALEYYRLQKMSEGSIILEKEKDGDIKSVTDAGGGTREDEFAPLSEIINILNERFGTDFTDADQLFFNQIEEEMVSDESLKVKAQVNTIENFKFGFEDIFLTILVDRMSQNQDIFTKIMNNETFAKTVKDYLLKKVYRRLKE